MTSKSALCAIVLSAAACLAIPASATTLVTSLAAFQAGAGGPLVSTPNPGNYDLTQSTLPITSSIALNGNFTLNLSTPVQVAAPDNGFPYLLSDGFTGELFIPVNAQGNQVTSITIGFADAVRALGFEVAPFSNAAGFPGTGFAGGPFTVQVNALGGSQTISLPGGSFNTGTTLSQFFGFYGGGIISLTISTSDPNGFAFGNFVDYAVVPEPASAALLLVGIAGMLARAGYRKTVA